MSNTTNFEWRFGKNSNMCNPDIANAENWGKYKKSESGVSWELPRILNSANTKFLFEELGFNFLGVVNSQKYKFEPPSEWSLEYDFNGSLNLFNASHECILRFPLQTKYHEKKRSEAVMITD